MSDIVDALTASQTARARMRAGVLFEAEADVTVTPAGLLAIGGLVAAILLSVVPIVRAARLARRAKGGGEAIASPAASPEESRAIALPGPVQP